MKIKLFAFLLFSSLGYKTLASTPPCGLGSICGATIVSVNQTETYYFEDDWMFSAVWQVSGGYVTTTWTVGIINYATIVWTTAGTGVVSITDGGIYTIADLPVTVTSSCTTPSAPIATLSQTTGCGTKTLSWSGTKPSTVTWYWQTTSTGMSTTYSSTYPATSSGTYYLRAKSNSGDCWSTAPPPSIPVTITAAPGPPSTPTISTNTCGPKTLTKGTTAGWFWQGTNSTGTDESAAAQASTFIVTTSGTYYLRAKNLTTNCWSTARAVSVTVNDPPIPTANQFTFCETETVILTTTGIPAGGTLVWYTNQNVLITTGTSYSPQLNSGAYTYHVKARSAQGCDSQGYAVVTVNVVVGGACDEIINWTESIGYSFSGSTAVPVASSKQYLDGFGNLLQAQGKDYTDNQVLASQPIYDALGNPAASTLSAPINRSEFGYKHKFVTNAAGQRYSANDFDQATTINNPNPVGNSGQGSLGWYYSTANTEEPLTPITNYPYARSYTPPGPDPITSKNSGPGDAYRMGANHESKSDRLEFKKGELAHYFSLQNHFATIQPVETNLISNFDAVSSTGFTPNQSVSVNSEVLNNETYVKVFSSTTGGTPGIWPIEGNKSVSPGQTYRFKVKGYRSTSGLAYLYVRNVSNSTNLVWQTILLPQSAANEAWVETTFTIPTGCSSVSIGVQWSNPNYGDTFYLNKVSFSRVLSPADEANVKHGYKFLSTDPDDKRTMTFVDADGKTLATALVTGSSGNPVTYTYDYWNYTYYNGGGQVVATVAPQGVTASPSLPNFVTTYKYDHLGQLIETTSIDEGTTRYVYSFDGMLRFSENQEQRNASPKRFSYTNYDYLGRLIESGEYTSNTSIKADAYVFEPHSIGQPNDNSVLGIADKVGSESGTSVNTSGHGALCSEYTLIFYDKQASDFPSDPNHTAQGNSIGQNVLGQVTKTENHTGSKTWYNYDEFGELLWTKQSIPVLGYKTIDYTYDILGNVTKVEYQKGSATDGFDHHYTYDADQRLVDVKTNKYNTTPEQRAKYKYYLHGPLKRVELGTNKQGIDYTYTITGALKAINHSNPTEDPGKDGMAGSSFPKDAFGMNMHYYDNDYTPASSTAVNMGSITLNETDYPNNYSGGLRASSYHNSTDFDIINTGENKMHLYAYQYDPVNQMTDARYGNVNKITSSTYTASLLEAYRENVTGYDKNGNILSLNRKGKDTQVIGNYNYLYETATNKLDKVNHNGAILTDFTYNSIGQMTQQTEGGNTLKVEYNVMGLVKKVLNGTNQHVQEFKYDDMGNRYLRIDYTNGVASKNTYYVYDASGNVMAIYEQPLPSGTVQLVEVPIYGAGRIGMYKPLSNIYFYEVNDHLGNVRAVIGEQAVDTYTATMESENVANEEPALNPPFRNITARRVVFTGANHTPGGNEVVRLNNINPAGPTIQLDVSPGDKIDMSAWAYYESGTGYNNAIDQTTMINAIATAFGGILGAPGEAGKIFANVQSGFPGTLGTSSSSSLPAAFLMYVLYDQNGNRITFGSRGVTIYGNMAKEQLVQDQITIEQPGFIYICLINRSNSNKYVYFDDLVVKQTHSNIVAGADFYPFGLVQEGREVLDEAYRYGYQGQFSEENETTGWNEFQLRMYDARFGRWISPDPYGQFASPYVGMGNIPNMGSDPDGGWCCNGFIAGIQNSDVLLDAVVTVTATRIAPRAISTAILKTMYVAIPTFLSGRTYSFDIHYVDNRSSLYKFLEKTTGLAYGLSKSLIGDLTPQFVKTDDPDFYTNAERAQIGGTLILLFLNRGVPINGGQLYYATPTGPSIPVLNPVVVPTTRATDVHGTIEARGKGANRNDKKMIDDVARIKGIKNRDDFGKFIERTKGKEGRGGADNYTWEELLDLADEFIELGGR